MDTIENRLDDYPTCAATYVTFRIYSGDIPPQEVSAMLCLTPTRAQTETRNGAPLNGWFLSTKDKVDSRDVRRHLDCLLEQIVPVRNQLSELQNIPGVWMDIFCYWRSAHGHGGPTLDPKHMRSLADLDLEIGFDFY